MASPQQLFPQTEQAGGLAESDDLQAFIEVMAGEESFEGQVSGDEDITGFEDASEAGLSEDVTHVEDLLDGDVAEQEGDALSFEQMCELMSQAAPSIPGATLSTLSRKRPPASPLPPQIALPREIEYRLVLKGQKRGLDENVPLTQILITDSKSGRRSDTKRVAGGRETGVVKGTRRIQDEHDRRISIDVIEAKRELRRQGEKYTPYLLVHFYDCEYSCCDWHSEPHGLPCLLRHYKDCKSDGLVGSFESVPYFHVCRCFYISKTMACHDGRRVKCHDKKAEQKSDTAVKFDMVSDISGMLKSCRDKLNPCHFHPEHKGLPEWPSWSLRCAKINCQTLHHPHHECPGQDGSATTVAQGDNQAQDMDEEEESENDLNEGEELD